MEQLRPWQNYGSIKRIQIPLTEERSDMTVAITHYDTGYDRLAEKFGIEVVSRTDWRHHFRCGQYVFATVKKEPWAQENAKLPVDLFYNGLEYLWRRGYEPISDTSELESGDIVGYRMTSAGTELSIFGHFGLMDQGTVVSKFNEGHIFRHALSQIPSILSNVACNEAIFLRKVANRYEISPEKTQDGGYYLPASETRQRIEDAGPYLDDLEDISGIRVLEDRSQAVEDSVRYRCHQYALGVRLNETWCQPYGQIQKDERDHPLFAEPFNFLQSNGYKDVSEPQNNDLVVYLKRRIPGMNGYYGGTSATHFGIWQDGKVQSKFAFGHIVEHELNLLPNRFGDSVRFMRKASK